MEEERFDPTQLSSDASLNQVVVADLAAVPEHLVGQRASDLCSRDALLALAAEAGTPGLPPDRLASELGAMACQGAHQERERATRVLRSFGSHLGALLATLRHPDTQVAQGNTPVRRGCFAHWLSVEGVWLAGGLMQPATSAPILEGPASVAASAARACPVGVLPHAPLAPLIGAARRANCTDGFVVVADLGHTTIKTAVAVVRGRQLTDLSNLQSTAAPPREAPEEVAGHVADALAAAWARAGRSPATEFIASVASYTEHGLPIDDGRSLYGGIGPDVARQTAARLERSDVAVRFVHDGTAAANSVTSDARTATITAGTWLGVGFAPSPQARVGVASEFAVG